MTMIIAEISGNHGGDYQKAIDMIYAAAACGCHAVKFQLYHSDDLGDPANNHIYEKCRVPVRWLDGMFRVAKARKILLFASVFAPWAVQTLKQYDPFAYKIASPESTRLGSETYRDLVSMIRFTPAELWISSGAADAQVMNQYWPDVFFYCKQGYPAKIDDADLRYVAQNCCGFSDHTPDVAGSLAMIGAGATHIEKHFKLDDDCVDAAFSLNPEQMKLLCELAQ